MVADKTSYCDEPGYRVLDLRQDGINCIPVLGFSDFSSVRNGPDFHYHPGCMEFCLCLKGNLIFDTLEKEYPFMPGHVFVSAPHEPHHLRNNPSGLMVYRLLFKIPKPGQRILGLDDRGSEWLARSLTHLPKRLFASSPTVKSSFEKLFFVYDNISRNSPSRKVKMQATALNLMIALVDAARHTPTKAPDKISEIAKRIKEKPDADYPIDDLAKEVNLSVSAFTTAFKRAQGLPLHAYVLHCRVNRAKRLLLTTKRTVTSIGQELRFYSTQHFALTFKRIIGMYPQAFRRSASPCPNGCRLSLN